MASFTACARARNLVARWSIIVFGLSLLAAGLPAQKLEQRPYKVFIVTDTLKDKFVELQNGFRETLDKLLVINGASAYYTVLDTKTDKTTVQGIIAAIEEGKPDLICVVNSSGVFADTNITSKLTDPRFRFVSENCIPLQSGMAKTWAKPGGNVTGVGVFVQFSSILRLAKAIDPKLRKLLFWTWDSVKPVTDYFEAEIKSACKATGTELVEFKRIRNAEEQFDYMSTLDAKGPGHFAIEGLSAWAHKDGSYADMAVEEVAFYLKSDIRVPIFVYEETGIKAGYPAGACIIWYDLGAQLAEKGIKVLKGAKPGDLPWEYPRKYNLMFNLAGAKKMGLKIPEELLASAYRVYTDFDGNFVGQKR